jgi:hypothetical protein
MCRRARASRLIRHVARIDGNGPSLQKLITTHGMGNGDRALPPSTSLAATLTKANDGSARSKLLLPSRRGQAAMSDTLATRH